MSHNRSKKENVRYTLAEEIALLAFLNTRKVSADNGTTTAMNFKKSDWKAAADMLNKNKTDGEMRTYVSCKAKYRQVSCFDVLNRWGPKSFIPIHIVTNHSVVYFVTAEGYLRRCQGRP